MVIKPIHKEWSRKQGLFQAMKTDALSLSAFEVGLFGWMALMRFVFLVCHPSE
jgi:hypothetical protein